ncbi:hypothetical protein [Gloeocapsopsis dulcis]|uniref:hypothetical protein n=1 Tax=Gloeocapsopsis dulcis TaxID=2859516 RepID=UPI0018C78323|nr:hypothetical protein [Gloeocapsopsis dulcis]WNN91607.1 hypothetical protein P0S91_11275 [Gloeocapsopsis dulcis]
MLSQGKEYYYLQHQYVATHQSQIFPNLPIVEVIPQYIAQSKVQGRNAAVKAFRAWV